MSENPDTRMLGIDLGGSKILTMVANAGGQMLARDYSITPAREGVNAVIQAIVESVRRVLAQARIAIDDIGAIGLGAPGLSNPESGILFTSPHLPGWQDVPLRDIIEKMLGKKTFLINDANAAALGEMYFGAAKGSRHFIYITVSTGIGGGIIINSKIYTGAIGMAGEVGHMVIDDKGPPCNCGNRGCWETLASGTALAREAKDRIKAGAQTAIVGYAEGDIEKINAEAVHQAAQAGDRLANELIDRTAYYLGVGLANLINIFNPEVIVIGGGLANIGDRLLKPAFEEAGRRAFLPAYQAVRFARAKLGADSGALGAAVFALEKMRETDKVHI